MAQAASRYPQGPTRITSRRAEVIFAAAALVLMALLFGWAKWDPYWHKLPALARSHQLGPNALTGSARRPPAVSLGAGWQFLSSYLLAVWPAIVAGLVTGAAVQALVPRRWLASAFAGDTTGSTVRAVAAGLPMMLCTCCSAPVTVGLRRARVPVRPALAYWLATPLLNPAVIVFTALALPWRWAALRLGMGVALLLASLVVATVRPRSAPPPAPVPLPADRDSLGMRRFGRQLAGLSLRLLPEYLILIFALGALRGDLFPLGHALAGWGIGAAVVLAVAGTLVAIPTAGEVLVVAALLAAGFPAWLAAALLVTLPATSLPSLAMVVRSFPRRVAIVVPALTVLAGVLSAGVALGISP